MGAGLVNARGGPLVEIGVAAWGLEHESGHTFAVESLADGGLLLVARSGGATA
jgi:hypothetical protein